jgi:hypothetical protein
MEAEHRRPARVRCTPPKPSVRVPTTIGSRKTSYRRTRASHQEVDSTGSTYLVVTVGRRVVRMTDWRVRLGWSVVAASAEYRNFDTWLGGKLRERPQMGRVRGVV